MDERVALFTAVNFVGVIIAVVDSIALSRYVYTRVVRVLTEVRRCAGHATYNKFIYSRFRSNEIGFNRVYNFQNYLSRSAVYS